jgi:FAD/FMN-containing dehydrogenase
MQGAQGTMGIATWASTRCQSLPKLRKLLTLGSHRLDDLLEVAYRVLRFRYGDEIVICNSTYFAYLSSDDRKDIQHLRKVLPQWVLMVILAGHGRLPEEQVAYQEQDIAEFASTTGHRLESSLPGRTPDEVIGVLTRPSGEPYWRLRYKGSCQDVFFLSTLDRTPAFVATAYGSLQSFSYPHEDVGIYVQPLMQGVACHCEFTLPYDPVNQDESDMVARLHEEMSLRLLRVGAYYSRPYGTWAAMAYGLDAQTAAALRKVKNIFDPHNVMNPGKLCFKN